LSKGHPVIAKSPSFDLLFLYDHICLHAIEIASFCHEYLIDDRHIF
jgi:hypothetical protein